MRDGKIKRCEQKGSVDERGVWRSCSTPLFLSCSPDADVSRKSGARPALSRPSVTTPATPVLCPSPSCQKSHSRFSPVRNLTLVSVLTESPKPALGSVQTSIPLQKDSARCSATLGRPLTQTKMHISAENILEHSRSLEQIVTPQT